MDFTYETDPAGGCPSLCVGARRADNGKLALVWAVNARGKLKRAQAPTAVCFTVRVDLVPGDTIFMLRTENIIAYEAASVYVEGQNVRRLTGGKIIGPAIKQWIPSAFLPPSIREEIQRWINKEMSLGKNFVEEQARPKSNEIVYSTEPGKLEAPTPDLKDAFYGKKRRAL
jgi:hypothetical protein